MVDRVADIVEFRGDRLFNGAVNIEWFTSDVSKAKTASEAFVFHGPKYHGVRQEDVGDGHSHKLIDTANFVKAIIQRCYGLEDQPFTLAIAGYGTGKSHLGLTLANLVSDPMGQNADTILSALDSADSDIAQKIRLNLREASQPCLAITLNGMRGFDLTAEITRQVTIILKKAGHPTTMLDELRPRFGQAISLIKLSNDSVKEELILATHVDSINFLTQGLENHDELLYAQVHDFFAARGMPIRALSGETVRDVVDIVVREYCGKGKPYRSLLILFDEFGKYTEFATERSQIAGSGALQDLFEAVQANSHSACFVGFIQFELNAYIQRVAPEYKNEILRYVTRYQSANKLYLSINLETLIASLLEKKQEDQLARLFDNTAAIEGSKKIMSNLTQWFPSSKNHRVWEDQELFHSVVRKGCWPLSPYATWLLFYLASAGKHLQERSALALLGNTFQRFGQTPVEQEMDWSISAVDLWSEDLEKDLTISEETGQQGSITLAYANVMAKHGNRLNKNQRRLLQAVVLASKLGLVASGKEDAILALGQLSSVSYRQLETEIKTLQENYNVIEWDEAFKAFDILGDAVPRTQFLSFVRQRVSSAYDEHGKAVLFASKASNWCDILVDLDCDFAEENRIYTREWRYSSITSNLDFLGPQIKMAADQWMTAVAVDQPRGTIIYTYVEPNRVKEEVVSHVKTLLRKASRESEISALPILVVLLHDVNGTLGQSLAEYGVLEEINESEKSQFGHLVGAHQEKLLKSIRETIDALIKERTYITALNEDMEIQRLSRVGVRLFEKIYKRPITFPFDGFSTARGNAANTCYELTHELMHGKLDYNSITAKPVEVKNRATKVLRDTWGIFNKNGTISRRPSHTVIRSLTEQWDDMLSNKHKLSVSEAVKKICQPPFGANIASAGLFLGVFMAPRYDKLIVMKNGVQIGTAQWLQEKLFRGKYLNITALKKVDFLLLEEASSEWDTLLDEWEQSEDYLSRINYLNRSMTLKQKTPIPPLLVYREESLRQSSIEANEKIQKLEKKRDEAWQKIEKSQKFYDCSLVLWAADILKEALDRMIDDRPLWTDGQIEDIEKDYISARQYTVQLFPNWLTLQSPSSDSPSAIGDFKHKMIRVFGKNLKRIGLEEEFKQIEAHTKKSVKNAEQIADAKEACRHIQAWISEHEGAIKIPRIAEVRALKGKGHDYSKTLQNFENGVSIPEIISLREPLTEVIHNLESEEKKIFDRAASLWDAKIINDEDLDHLAAEVDSLIHAFDGLPNDLEDLLSMKKALKLYNECHSQFINESLSWEDFDRLASDLTAEYDAILENEEIPWAPDDVIGTFYQLIAGIRESKSQKWMENLNDRINHIDSMAALQANQLMIHLQKTPLYLTNTHKNKLNEIITQVDKRLSDLSVDWLIEKFKELSKDRKYEFVEMIKTMLN
jgi:hypothetical protein